MTTRHAAAYVLGIRSNLLLIGASALGYFFFAGLRTFAVIFARGRFGISQGMVSVLVVVVGAGGLAGTLAGGYLTDRLIRRRVHTARLLVSGAGFVAAAVLFVPGFLSASLAVALPIFVLGAALVGVPNPALDAARLDVVPGRLWGRAEAVRTFLKAVLEAAAPLLFGLVSAALGGGAGNVGPGVDAAKRMVSPAVAAGIAHTFVLMLVPLAVSGALLLRGRNAYLRDIATASESERWNTPPGPEPDGVRPRSSG
jgi:sugar phosphate permease